MTETMKVEVIKETNRYYEFKTPDGKVVKAFKIDKYEIAKSHDERIKKVAEAFTSLHIQEIIQRLETILNDLPTVETYLGVVTELAPYLRECYDVVGNPNLFHYPIKYIDPDIYGRADGLVKRVTELLEDMWEVANKMVKMGKLNYVKKRSINYHKYTIFAPSDPKSYAGDHLDAEIKTFNLKSSIDIKYHRLKTEIA